jgi:thiosulfate reductase / polysulfide reductase chain A
MADSVSRRQFLGTIAAGGAATAIRPGEAEARNHPPGWRGKERVEKIATNCEMCFWRCGVLASVSNGRVLRVEGNPDHPLTRGRLCARGNAGTGLLYDPDRLKYPLLRIGERGEGKFRRVRDEALDVLARKLTDIKRQHGPESVAFFPHGIGSRFFGTLMKAYGTPNSAEPSFSRPPGEPTRRKAEQR